VETKPPPRQCHFTASDKYGFFKPAETGETKARETMTTVQSCRRV
jgi:hypothetical protein